MSGAFPPKVVAAGERMQLREDRLHALTADGDQDHEVGIELAAHLLDGFDRRVGAEIDDAPTSCAQREPERDQAEVVLLARQAGEHRHRA